MESLYYVMAWACHRKCRHCYEDRFRPYVRGALEAVVAEALRNFPLIIDNFPQRFTYLDRDDPRPDGSFREKTGRVILSGGESLLDAIRERVTYKVIDRLRERYAEQGGVKIVVQTTGDLVTDAIVDDLLARGVWMISVAGVDDFHVGMEGPDKQKRFVDRLTTLFERHGMRRSGLSATTRNWHEEAGPLFSFFGATPDAWIGKLWPRGRAWQNGLSTATLADNFCNRWSGGLNFLRHAYNGSEVSVEPDGAVYPCCVKTKVPIGSLLEDNLIDILESLSGIPAFEAIDSGHPERMGLAYGWSEAKFVAASRTTTPHGQTYENLCIGCDRFHAEVLGPVIEEAKRRRRSARGKKASARPPLPIVPIVALP
ncbi:MAG TPA: radical SAM/SPASM domain-containing protein [Casimicrobiaceae bacterium]|nr:radical SAM/SPASM domain-containing protein [Casimicrobiaceae bacterium]